MPSLPGDWNSNARPCKGMMQAMKLDYSDKNTDLGALYPDHVEIM
jgi:hypothetical protein